MSRRRLTQLVLAVVAALACACGEVVRDPLAEITAAVAGVGEPPQAMAAYLAKVHERAYAITDADVAALAGLADDVVFEQTVAAAVAEGVRRLEAGLAVLP